jgi:hypothetical protein
MLFSTLLILYPSSSSFLSLSLFLFSSLLYPSSYSLLSSSSIHLPLLSTRPPTLPLFPLFPEIPLSPHTLFVFFPLTPHSQRFSPLPQTYVHLSSSLLSCHLCSSSFLPFHKLVLSLPILYFLSVSFSLCLLLGSKHLTTGVFLPWHAIIHLKRETIWP